MLFGVCTLALFHWAHRFRYTLYDGLQLKRHSDIVDFLCYGVAAAGSLMAGDLLLRVL